MTGARLYSVTTWCAMAATVGILVILWLNLYMLHMSGQIHQIDRNTVVDKDVVTAAGFASLALIVVALYVKVRRKSAAILLQEIIAEIRRSAPQSANGGKPQVNWSAVKKFFKVGLYDILLLGKMGVCEDFQQWLGHFMIMWGFIGLFITTSLDALVNPEAVPLPILHPVRIIGNVSGVIYMAGLTLAILRRLLKSDVRQVTTLSDFSFLIIMYGSGLTGFMVQWYADTGNAFGTAATYIAHLFFVALLIPTAPWTKFIHALWRPSWIIYSRFIK